MARRSLQSRGLEDAAARPRRESRDARRPALRAPALMLRHEAELEAARLNRDDPDRERFEFYALDESAGLAADAWDVAARLRRRAPPTEAVTVRAEAPAPAHAPPVDDPARVHHPPTAAGVAEAHPHVEPLPEPFEAATEPQAAPGHRAVAPRRPGWFARTVGALVVAMALLWLALVVLGLVLVQPDVPLPIAVYPVGAAVGVLALALGVAIRRS